MAGSGSPCGRTARPTPPPTCRVAAARLAEVLDHLASAAPGVPVDVVAHSQGGLVARHAIAIDGAAADTLITLGTPHAGSPLARLLAVGRTAPVTAAVLRAGEQWWPYPLSAAALGQMVPHSDFLTALAARPVPDDVAVLAVGSGRDLAVPFDRSQLPGETGSLVDADHSGLPGDPEVLRDVALAVAGRGPECRPLVRYALAAASGAIEEAVLDAGAVLAPRLAAPTSGLGTSSLHWRRRRTVRRITTPGRGHPRSPSRRWSTALLEPSGGHPRGTCRHHEPTARGRSALRPPDTTLEPQDGALHLGRAERHLRHRPRQDHAAHRSLIRVRPRHRGAGRHGPLRGHEEAGPGARSAPLPTTAASRT